MMVVLLFLSCNHEDTDDYLVTYLETPLSGQIVEIDSEILQIKAKAVDTLTIGLNSFVLESNLNRNFMPFCPPDGNRMTSFIRLVCTDSIKI